MESCKAGYGCEAKGDSSLDRFFLSLVARPLYNVGMTDRKTICQVAVPVPIRQTYDYFIEAGAVQPQIGTRARVSFGRRQMVGVVTGLRSQSEVPCSRLKRAQVLDSESVFGPSLFELLIWAADYYHHAIGEVLQTALPVLLRQGKPLKSEPGKAYKVTQTGAQQDLAQFKRAPAQQAILRELQATELPVKAEQLASVSKTWRRTINLLLEKEYVEYIELADELALVSQYQPTPAPELSQEQKQAVQAISQSLGCFQRFLLYGITGSGKTEVYLSVIDQALSQGKQVLVLVPEISLTPQLVRRFKKRITAPMALIHSGMAAGRRLQAWRNARSGNARLILGTRSAVFASMPDLGLIIVDEEHDGSYKQQDGFRYHGRDVAIKRAQNSGIPVVLGSATPSLETWEHARRGEYSMFKLSERHGNASLPRVQLLDMRQVSAPDGLSPNMIQTLSMQLDKGEQSLIFINRRGYAPALLCRDCGWVAACSRCDANLVFHQKIGRLRCHHCGHDESVLKRCPVCENSHLRPIGEGTERIADTLAKRLPKARIGRLDRDTTRRQGSLEETLEAVRNQSIDIIVGTQMLVKGHHFPNVTMVGVVNADQGLYSVDYRASEQLFQQVMQVSGRAGRADKPGVVLVQTYHPGHRLFAALENHDFELFARETLNERHQAGFPPFSFLALLRAESTNKLEALQFVSMAHELASSLDTAKDLGLGEPVYAPMERKAGRYRTQLLISAKQRPKLHLFLTEWLVRVQQCKQARRVRWSLDVDPQDLY